MLSRVCRIVLILLTFRACLAPTVFNGGLQMPDHSWVSAALQQPSSSSTPAPTVALRVLPPPVRMPPMLPQPVPTQQIREAEAVERAANVHPWRRVQSRNAKRKADVDDTDGVDDFYNRTPVNRELTRCARSHCKRGVYATVHCKLPHAFTGHSTSESDGSSYFRRYFRRSFRRDCK